MAEEKTETKQCSKCKVFQPMIRYVEGRKQCNVCLSQKQRYREKHQEELKLKNKDCREQNKEALNEKVECYVCKCLIHKAGLWKHGQSIKHQRNLKSITTLYL